MATSSLQELLVASSPDGRIIAYDASTGFIVARFSGSRTPRRGLTLIAKKFIAASHVSPDSGNGFLHLYYWWSFTPFHRLPMPEPVAPLVATPDGSYLFAGGVSGRIHSISVPSGDVLLSAAAHSKPITCLELNDDGSLIFSGSDDGTISVFATHQLLADEVSSQNPRNLSALQRFVGHESAITAITTGAGRCSCALISCSLDSTCKFWSLTQRTPLRSVTFPCTIWEMKMDALESEFFCAGSDGFVYKGELKAASRSRGKQGRQIIRWREKQRRPLTSMATLRRGQYVVAASEEGSICFWDAGRGKLIKFLDPEHTGSISHLAVLTGLNGHVMRAPLARMNENGGGGFHKWDREFMGASAKEGFEFSEKMAEMKEQLAVSAMDRKRSIDSLETALGGYEKLMKLILREVEGRRASTSNNGVEDETKMKEK